MIPRILICAGLIAACGFFTSARPGLTGFQKPTEKWMEQTAPDKVTGIAFTASSENPEQSYKMGEETYDQLQPHGIVSRVFGKIDTVMICGDKADSFHDQSWCFTSQGWKVVEDTPVQIPVEGKGTVLLRELKLEGPSGRATALFGFRGPSGEFHGQFGEMWSDFFFRELKSGQVQVGTFYRFLADEVDASPEALKAFAGDYLSQSLPAFDSALKTLNKGA